MPTLQTTIELVELQCGSCGVHHARGSEAVAGATARPDMRGSGVSVDLLGQKPPHCPSRQTGNGDEDRHPHAAMVP